jgi:hypothetical protein
VPRLWIAAIAIAVAMLGLAPAAAQAAITSSSITSWVSSNSGSTANDPYLVSYDNLPTTLTVSGTAVKENSTDRVDVVCYYGSGPSSYVMLVTGITVTNGAFNTGPRSLKTTLPATTLSGHTCRLRAVNHGDERVDDTSAFAGPQLAISGVGLPSESVGGKPYDFYVNASTLTANAGWNSAGSCGPFAAPLDGSFGSPTNLAINCAGSLLGSDVPAPGRGHRSEVQVDGQDAYDAASAQAVMGNLTNFPPLTATVDSDPNDNLVTSQSTEGWVTCPGVVIYPPTASTCRHFAPAGVQLQRNASTSDGGQVVTMTDTWSSTDGIAHRLDLLYDDVVGLPTSGAQRGYEFPGQSSFSAYGQGATLPGPSAVPGSILMRTNSAAPDGTTSESVGAITFSTPPSGYAFVSNGELEEHTAVNVPASGGVSLTYIYSTAFTVAQTRALALAAQDRLQPLAVSVTSPGNGATTSTSPVGVIGTASAGSGIGSLVVAGQTVPVGAAGAWSASVPLNPGSNAISISATDAAGATAQGQVTVVYQPPSSPPPPPPPPAAKCKVPRTKGMKLPAAERTLRRAHCRVGKIKHVRSKKTARGRVMSTTPRPGRRLRAGAKVQLFVSRGP